MSTLRRVVSVLKEYPSSLGVKVDQICETICENLEIEMNEAIRNKIMRAITKGLSSDLICEDRGRYKINKLHRNCVNMLPSVSSFMEYSMGLDNRIGEEIYCDKCLNCTPRLMRRTNRNSKRIIIDNSYMAENGEFSDINESPTNLLHPRNKHRRKESGDKIESKREITLDEAFKVIRRTVRENKKRMEQIKKHEDKKRSLKRRKQKSKFTSETHREYNGENIYDNKTISRPENEILIKSKNNQGCSNKNFYFTANTANPDNKVDLDEKVDFIRADVPQQDTTSEPTVLVQNIINPNDNVDISKTDNIIKVTDDTVMTTEECQTPCFG